MCGRERAKEIKGREGIKSEKGIKGLKEVEGMEEGKGKGGVMRKQKRKRGQRSGVRRVEGLCGHKREKEQNEAERGENDRKEIKEKEEVTLSLNP